MPSGFFNRQAVRGKIDAPIDQYGASHLHRAVMNDDLAAVRDLLHQGYDPYLQDAYGCSPLYQVILRGKKEMLRAFLDAGTRLDQGVTFFGSSPLMLALEKKCDVSFIKMLLKHRASVLDGNSDGFFPMHYAVQYEDTQVLKALLAYQTPLEIKSSHGNTALHMAISLNNKEMISELIKNGAKPDVQDNNLRTGMHIVAAVGDEEMFDFILPLSQYIGKHNDYVSLEEGWTPLMMAVKSGHLPIVKRLVDLGADVNQVDHEKRNALYLAVESGHVDIAKYLLSHGADLSKAPHQRTNGRTILHEAVHAPNAKYLIPLLIKSGMSVNTKGSYHTSLLMEAIEYGKKDVLEMLLRYGANPNEKDDAGWRAIDLVCLNDEKISEQCEMAKLLVRYGADINLCNTSGLSLKETPLYMAVMSRSVELIEFLLSRGADVNGQNLGEGETPIFAAVRHGSQNLIKHLVAQGADINHVTEGGDTILHFAAHKGNARNLDFVLSLGLGLEVKNKVGMTPILSAAKRNWPKHVNILAKHGADINAADDYGNTVLHHMARLKNVYALKDFIRRKNLKIDQFNQAGHTPLMIAARHGHVSVIKALLDNGADVNNRKGKMGENALAMAAKFNHKDCILALLKAGADMGYRDNFGRGLLHYAAENAQCHAIDIFLEKGADLNELDNEGRTPLHCAAEMGSEEVVQSLIEKNVSLDVKDANGLTPRDIALDQGFDDVVDLIDFGLRQQRANALAHQKVQNGKRK